MIQTPPVPLLEEIITEPIGPQACNEPLQPLPQLSLSCVTPASTHTAQRLKSNNREKYDLILNALREGIPLQRIANDLNASCSTVQAIRRLHASELPSTDELFARQSERVIEKAFFKLDEALDAGTIHPNNLPVTLGILLDKKAMLRGEPSQITEVRHSIDLSALRESMSCNTEIDVTPIPSHP